MRRSLGLQNLLAVALVVITIVVFLRVLGCGYVYDDSEYVFDNPPVRQGLSGQGIVWAFTSFHASNWHPLTWLSLMLDAQLYGIAPWGYHLTNLLLHSANVVLLFLLFSRMTGAVWKSGFVAALFAVHPLHVESVAWIAERKDVLSTLFWLLTMLAYVRYAGRPRLSTYMPVVVCVALGLMSKPMLVTLPFALLLLDYWPLGRLHLARSSAPVAESSATRLVIEKMPLFLLAAASSVVTWVAQHSSGAAAPLQNLPLVARVGNAAAAYVAYPAKMVWPRGLTGFYPHPGTELAVWKAALASSILVLASAAAIRLGRRHPYAVVGWLWYLGTLVPVIGLVQVGRQAMADRYTYVPLMGLFILAAWGIPDLLGCRRTNRESASISLRLASALPVAAGVILGALAVCTWVQTGYWRDDAALFRHTLRFTRRNAFAHVNLGADLMHEAPSVAEKHFRAAIRLEPDNGAAHGNLGVILEKRGSLDDAMKHYRLALRADPRDPRAHFRIGVVLRELGRAGEALPHLYEAARIRPHDDLVQANLAAALEQQGRFDEAIEHYAEAIRLNGDNADALHGLGNLLVRQGNPDQAIERYRDALRAKPDHVHARMALAIVLGDQGRVQEAEREYREVIRRDPGLADAYANLGALLAGRRRLDEAVDFYRKALEIEPGSVNAHRNLAIVLYLRAEYAAAWREVEWCREHGVSLPDDFLQALSGRMPEPIR